MLDAGSIGNWYLLPNKGSPVEDTTRGQSTTRQMRHQWSAEQPYSIAMKSQEEKLRSEEKGIKTGLHVHLYKKNFFFSQKISDPPAILVIFQAADSVAQLYIY